MNQLVKKYAKTLLSIEDLLIAPKPLVRVLFDQLQTGQFFGTTFHQYMFNKMISYYYGFCALIHNGYWLRNKFFALLVWCFGNLTWYFTFSVSDCVNRQNTTVALYSSISYRTLFSTSMCSINKNGVHLLCSSVDVQSLRTDRTWYYYQNTFGADPMLYPNSCEKKMHHSNTSCCYAARSV